MTGLLKHDRTSLYTGHTRHRTIGLTDYQTSKDLVTLVRSSVSRQSDRPLVRWIIKWHRFADTATTESVSLLDTVVAPCPRTRSGNLA